MSAPQIHTIRIPTPGGFASFCEIIEAVAKSTTSSEEQKNEKENHDEGTPTSKLVGIPSEVSLSSTCASTACCTNDGYDSDGSISSISSSDEKEDEIDSLLDDEDEQDKIRLESPRSPRSIFKDHWQKSGLQPMALVHETNDHHHDPHHRNMTTRNNNAMPRLPFEWEEENKKKRASLLLKDDNTYEKTLKLQEGVLNNNATSRRSIFGHHQSEPFLSRSGTNGEIQGITSNQRTYSVPTRIGSKVPKPSCLRSSKHVRSEKQRVVFSPEVSIMKYHIPVEEWGTKGWSKWFV